MEAPSVLPTPGAPNTPGEYVRRVRTVSGVPWRRLFSYLRPHAGPFAIGLVGLLLGSGLALLVPLVVASLVTEIVAGGDSSGLDRLIIGLFGLFLAQSAGSFIQAYFLGVVGERVVATMRGQLFERLVTLSLDFHAKSRVGELVSRLSSDVTLIRTMLTQTTTSMLSSVIGLIGSIVILFTLSPTLLLAAVILAPALIAVAIIFGRPLERVSTQVQDKIAHSTATAEEALGGIRVVKSYVREGFEIDRYTRGPRRRGPAWLEARDVAGGLRRDHGLPRVRGRRNPALVYRPPGHRRHARDRDAHRVPAVRDHDRREPRDDRRALRAVPRGDWRRGPGVRDHRPRADDPGPRRGGRRRARHGRHRARQRVVRVRDRATGSCAT